MFDYGKYMNAMLEVNKLPIEEKIYEYFKKCDYSTFLDSGYLKK